MSVSVFINACRLLSALPSLSQFGRGRLSLVPISFYALSLLLGPCRLSEFTLAGLHVNINKKKLNFNLSQHITAVCNIPTHASVYSDTRFGN